MSRTALNKPILITLYGFPGSGKSYIARNLAEHLHIAHVSADRIRGELFKNPQYTAQENSIILHLMNYMADEFLSAGVSVIYDANSLRVTQRKQLRELASKHRAGYMLIWIQIDPETAYSRTLKRDKRTADDHFAQSHTRRSFNDLMSHMQNPSDESYLVVSGKHSFNSQKATIFNKLYQIGHINSDTIQQSVTRPDLINLVPSHPAGQEGYRNISVL